MEEEINSVIDVLKRGGIILYPTDTVWGIGCDATNPIAVEKVFAIKHRPDSKALISLVDSFESAERLTGAIPENVKNCIYEANEPVTVVYPEVKGIARNIVAADGSAAIRITSEAISRAICRRFGKPLVSTSANISGEPNPASFDEIASEIIESVDYVMAVGREKWAPKPSRIIKTDKTGNITVIRN